MLGYIKYDRSNSKLNLTYQKVFFGSRIEKGLKKSANIIWSPCHLV